MAALISNISVMAFTENEMHYFLGKQLRFQQSLCQKDDLQEKKAEINAFIASMLTAPQPLLPSLADFEWINSEQIGPSENLSDCIVVIDFFTYCCINCLHILPILKRLECEFSKKNGFVVIGVHSAKFENEKDSSHINDAVEKYDISHPVINDADGRLWSSMAITCWPTVLILGPGNRVFFYLIGENNISKWLSLYSHVLYDFFEQKTHFSTKLPSILVKKKVFDKKQNLRFPGKIRQSPNQSLIAISDSGNNRIVITDISGNVEHVIGDCEPALKDGHFTSASFNQPQGVAWLTDDILFVADTNNHCIRRILVSQQKVETIVSNNFSDSNCNGEEKCKIVSPWDLCIVDNSKIFIAMAGSHQICVYCLEDCCIFNKSCSSEQWLLVAGCGREENRNNRYPLKAAFAQPSGIVYSEMHNCLFIADSESSTVRKLNLKTGCVENVIGGSRDPLDLFAFGDIDGRAFDVRLQHPLGIAFNTKNGNLIVADSYNHKIKKIELETRECKTVSGIGTSGNQSDTQLIQASFNEPNGVCVFEEENYLLVCDTNNHCIKKIDFPKNRVSLFVLLFETKLQDSQISDKSPNDIIELECRHVSDRGDIIFEICLKFDENVHATRDSCHKIALTVSENDIFSAPIEAIRVEDFSFPIKLSLKPNLDTKISVQQQVTAFLDISVFVCDESNNLCSLRRLSFKQRLIVDPSMQTDSVVIKIGRLIQLSFMK